MLNQTQTGPKLLLSTLSTSEESLWFCYAASVLPSSVRKVLIFNKADWSAMTLYKLKMYKFTNTAKNEITETTKNLYTLYNYIVIANQF